MQLDAEFYINICIDLYLQGNLDGNPDRSDIKLYFHVSFCATN